MTSAHILLRNLTRNPLRTTLTGAVFALGIGTFVFAISFVVALIQIGQANAREMRLAVHHKTTIINMLPEGMRRKIEALDPDRRRLAAVCGMRWFGGQVPETKSVVQSLAADPDTFPLVYSADVQFTREEEERWLRDRQACVAGFGVAERFGWKIGDKITLKSSVPPYLELDFHLVKIMQSRTRQNVFYFRRDYMDESLLAEDAEAALCNIFWIKCQSEEGMRSLQHDIDAAFANSSDETKSEDENAFAAMFMQASGNIPGLMNVMAMVLIFIIALVAGNTMMMNIRERTRELAVLKALGFPNPRVFLIVLGESVLLALLGALSGVAVATALLPFVSGMLRKNPFLPLTFLELKPAALVVSICIAVAIGALAGLWPAFQALRLRTVDALRRAG